MSPDGFTRHCTRADLAGLTSMTSESQDELENVVLMTGAIYMALCMTERFEDVRVVGGEEGKPVIDVEIGFMKSPYRLTLQRLDEPKHSTPPPKKRWPERSS